MEAAGNAPRSHAMIRLLLSILFLFCCHLSAATLHVALGANVSRINPVLATDSTSAEISGWLFNGLFKYDKDGQIVGDIAESWRFIDPVTLEVKIKPGIQWHDGVPFNAEDIVFTYQFITSPKVFTPYATDFRFVENVAAKGSDRVVITYKKPYYKALVIWMMGILPRHIWEGVEDPMRSENNQKPVGTGPYKLSSMKTSGDIVLQANQHYFEHAPNIERIHYHFLPDPTSGFLMLKSQKLDIGGLSPLQYKKQIDAPFRKFYQTVVLPSYVYSYLGFNLRNKKFQDPRLRRAIDLAIDKRELVDILFFGYGDVCHGPFMPKTFAFPKTIPKESYDPAAAKKLLEEAGYGDDRPLEFEIVTNANNPQRMYAAQIIQHQLGKIGIKVEIRAMEWQAFLNTVVMPRRFEAILLGWSLGLMPDAYSIWHGSQDKVGGFNLVGYRSAKVDRLIEAAESETDMREVGKFYREIFRQIASDLPYIFLYIPDAITAVNRKISPIEPGVVGIMHNTIDWIKE